MPKITLTARERKAGTDLRDVLGPREGAEREMLDNLATGLSRVTQKYLEDLEAVGEFTLSDLATVARCAVSLRMLYKGVDLDTRKPDVRTAALKQLFDAVDDVLAHSKED